MAAPIGLTADPPTEETLLTSACVERRRGCSVLPWRRIRKSIPLVLRRPLRRLWLNSLGRLNDALAPNDRMVPWKVYSRTIGGGDFERVGVRYLQRFIEIGELMPTDRVLDVGCGVGRMAVPLTSYLSPEGSYRGFDVVKESVRWCTRRITPHYDTFRFDHVDVYNKHYNPGGTLNANSFDFPYPDASFDFVFLISVFTHLLPPDMKNYLSEVARVLAPGGRSFITYTLLNDEILRSIERGESHLPYVHLRDGYRTVEPDEPETSVAFYEEDVRALYDALRLQIIEPIRFGSWSGRDGDSHQDIVVARKLN